MNELANRLSNSVEAFNNACADLSQYADTLGYPPSLKAAQTQHVKTAYEIAFLGEDVLNYIRQLEAENQRLRDAQMVAHGHTEVEYYLVSKSLAGAKDIVPPDEFGYGLFPRVDALIAMVRAQAHPAPESGQP